MRPDDTTLTETGMAAQGAGQVLLLACGALAHEILALKAANGWAHLDLHCLPANLHLWCAVPTVARHTGPPARPARRAG